MSENWSQSVHDVATRRHKRTEAEWEAERKRLLDLIAEKDATLDVALALSKEHPTPSVIPLSKIAKSEATAFAIASDWHVEETVDPKTINHLNAFSLEIAEQRIHAFFRNVVRLTAIQRHGTKIERLVLALVWGPDDRIHP